MYGYPLAALLAALPAIALSQTPPARDALDRSQQERRAQENQLQLRLNGPPPIPRPLAPDEVARSLMLPTPGSDTPGTEILRRQPPPALPAAPRVASPGPPVPDSQTLLDESQRRRQLGYQSQLPATAGPPTPEDIVRQQALDTQQLQFQREQRAGQLGSEIMRNSERAMGR
jgi:hypothetical protein